MASKLTEEMISTRAQLLMASGKTLKELLGQFGEKPTSADRLELVMAADKLFMAEMDGESSGTSLLAFQQALAMQMPLDSKVIKAEQADNAKEKPQVPTAPTSVKFHKDFKISGQIDCKTGISYTSLIRQIELGVKKGHTEADVIDGVIRAVVPTSSLRSYLDGRQDLSLATLRGILRGHYAEKNSTELYTELAGAVQQPKETSGDFLMRAMDLRNKIAFASQESSDELKYSPDLVHKLFARTVQTGLRDQLLRQEMKAFLADQTKSDEELMDKLNKIVRRESENRQKVGKSVMAISKSPEPDVTSELLAEIKALKVEVNQLKTATAQAENQRRGPYQGKGCRSCKDQGRYCSHCWHCGSGDHRRRNCPKRQQGESGTEKSGSENSRGSR